MMNINDILKKKGKEKISMITAYDYSSAKLVDEAGTDMILVGDSLGMVVLGYDSTLPVTVDDMIYHGKSVCRARVNSFVVIDMPFMSYNVEIKDSIYNAGKIIKETGADAVKLEGGARTLETIKRIISMEIPVIGHLGLTPQSVNSMGGYRVQGKSEESAKEMLKDALDLEKAGVMAIVLEGIPENLAKLISEKLTIPTIGIGAGKYTDGQVLVFHDMLGFNEVVPKFVKKYANVGIEIDLAIKSYIDDVKNGEFPKKENIYKAQAEINKIY